MNPQQTGNAALDPTVRALYQLSPSSQDAVSALVRQLADREGLERGKGPTPPVILRK